MTLASDIKTIADKDGITPNFELLARYTDFRSDLFYEKYLHYKSKGIFIKPKDQIRDYKLNKYQNELFFFLIEIAENYARSTWAKDVGMAREDLRELEQMEKLHQFYLQIQTHGGYKKSEKSSDPRMKKINFLTDKNHSISIDSHKLCVTLLGFFEDYYFKNKSKISKKLNELTNRNPRQHEKQFVLGLKPFVYFLEKETVQWETKNSIYDFVSEFIQVLGIEISSTRIENALRTKRL